NWTHTLPPTHTTPHHQTLPTYPFQHEHFWTETTHTPTNADTIGLRTTTHPWLAATTPLANGDGHLLTGRLSPTQHPWLTHHTVYDTVLTPGTGLLEIAFAAAREVGADAVGELTMTEPLVLRDAVRLQVVVGAEAEGRRSISLYSQPENSLDGVWHQHAIGELIESASAGEDDDPKFQALAQWPPAGAEQVELDGFYEEFATQGLQYGPAFQGLTELWRKDDHAYGLIRLPDTTTPDDFGIHPALLDAALHTLTALRSTDENVVLPFEWTNAHLHATHSTELRVHITLDRAASVARIRVADGAGQPVASIEELRLREVTAEQIRTTEPVEHLYRVDFVAPRASRTTEVEDVAVLGAGSELAAALGGVPQFADVDALLASEDVPARILVDATVPVEGGDPTGTATRALTLLQRLLTEERLTETELTWVTRRAVGEGAQDLGHAPLWGLVRAAATEHSERSVRLIDLDEHGAELLVDALALADEPEIAVREGEVRVARVIRARATGTTAAQPPRLDPEGTVLITGGTGELGRQIAHHLVQEHGAHHLVLTSRQGPEAPGTTELAAQLRELGAESVDVHACDITDPQQTEQLITTLERPLTAVFHLAGILDDGLLTGQDTQRLHHVLAPKVDGALHLHHLTAHHPLTAFVLFSSAAGILGSAGQSTYAAANTYLDALAHHRQAQGLPATSLSWGLWELAGVGMTSRLGEADLSRIRRQGISALSGTQGMRLLDAALDQPHAHLAPIKLELASLQRSADRGEDVAARFRGLVRAKPRRAGGSQAAPSDLRDRLAPLDESERRDELIRLVRGEAATVLGVADASELGADQVLKDLGMDSLMAVELRRRLSTATEVTLPATLAFDHPTPTAITGLLLQRLELTAKPKKSRKAARTLTQADEPIAIVSMACRLPGGIHTPEAFWNLLSEGGDAISGFPKRWENLGIYDPDPEAAGKSYAREGGFLTDIEGFDAEFFGISPREAIAMDPQQRLVLETSWEALERAGIRPDTLTESRTGVYLGTMGSDYDNQHNHDLDALDGYLGTGNASSIISGRLSYSLGLQGPALTVDTACSSSLVAMHLGINALRTGECELALVGGVTVMSTPSLFVEFSRLKGMATDGRCKSFSDDADGAGWSEGVGILVLKRVSAARRDGDKILAVVKGSAVNQDGRSQGLTAPNGPSQQRVVQEALSSARLTPADIDAIEAHGTGTPLGDPIEAGALTEIFGPGRAADRPLYLGSSKSNIGHAQAAAGVAGVIKMVMALQHESLPKTLHAEAPSSHIEWDGSGLELLQDNQPWQRGTGRIRRAGISSFGLSGTNAHVILEEAPESTPVETEPAPFGALPIVLSARTPKALRTQAGHWATWLAAHREASLSDIARTSALHRTHFDVRAGVVASTVEEAAEALRALASGGTHPNAVTGTATARGKIVFVYPGQGSQWHGMGTDLYAHNPAFAEAIDACDAALEP
ncbi:SDR family NAD(P)-dependent oxidoreductase, partial [Streptomyces sp. NPDC032198]|uniref:type I polyketide synthase n=1 Tax=Streptomyces sp. NPDC032198 TaxID=3155127 RepID=UPI0033FE19FD